MLLVGPFDAVIGVGGGGLAGTRGFWFYFVGRLIGAPFMKLLSLRSRQGTILVLSVVPQVDS